jgi:hypothetical protein
LGERIEIMEKLSLNEIASRVVCEFIPEALEATGRRKTAVNLRRLYPVSSNGKKLREVLMDSVSSDKNQVHSFLDSALISASALIEHSTENDSKGFSIEIDKIARALQSGIDTINMN